MIVSPKKILWPTDFSPLSFKAAEYACGFRELFGAELHVLHVSEPSISPTLGFGAPFEVDTGTVQSQLVAAARAHLDKITSETFPSDVSIVSNVVVGNPWDEVCIYARDEEIDLIIVATHGRTGLKHVVLGSVAERIVQHAPCPVLVVKSFERDFTMESRGMHTRSAPQRREPAVSPAPRSSW